MHGTSKKSQDEEQDDSTYEGDENRASQSTHRRCDAECGEQPSTDESTDYADDDVTDYAITGAAHDKRGEHASDESYNEPGQESHAILELKRVVP